MAAAKAAGTRFETLIATHLAAVVDDRIERRRQSGSKDRGDIASVRDSLGRRVVVECKDYAGRLLPAEWTREAQTERDNDNAVAGVVVAKRRGTTEPGQQYVLMLVDDFVALLGK